MLLLVDVAYSKVWTEEIVFKKLVKAFELAENLCNFTKNFKMHIQLCTFMKPFKSTKYWKRKNVPAHKFTLWCNSLT